MNYLDIVLIIVLAIFAIAGFIKGFVKSLASLVALVLGIFLGIKLSDYVANLLAGYFNWSEDVLFIIAFVIIFILVVLVVSLIGKLLNKVLSSAALGFVNKLAGLVFGLAKGIFILSVLIALMNYIDRDRNLLKQELRKTSKLYAPLEKIAPVVIEKFRELEFKAPSLDDTQDQINDNLKRII